MDIFGEENVLAVSSVDRNFLLLVLMPALLSIVSVEL